MKAPLDGKHDIKVNKKKKSRKKAVLRRIIAVELVLLAFFCFASFTISWDRINDRRSEAVYTSMENFDEDMVVAYADESLSVAMEQIKQVRDETVWMKREANYRTGPGTSYDVVGQLFKYASMTRTGVTYNKWSQVIVDGEECYIKNKYLTTEAPIITAGGQKGQYQLFALSQLANYGWADSEIIPLIKLWDRESGWNPSSHNGSSGAHGIPQALPASKMAAYGSDYYTNGNTQILWGLNYIANRYGSPSNAWGHFQSSGWY